MIDESKYTQLPNAILNAPDMSNREFRLTAVLYGLTWNGKKKAKASINDIIKLSGMTRHTAIKSIREVVERGIFSRNGSTWQVVQKMHSSSAENALAVVQKMHSSSAENALAVVQKMHSSSAENALATSSLYTIQEVDVDEEEPTTPQKQLEKHFTTITAIFPPTFQDDKQRTWDKYINGWVEFCNGAFNGDIEPIKKAMSDTVTAYKSGDRNYTIKSPMSLQVGVSNRLGEAKAEVEKTKTPVNRQPIPEFTFGEL